MVIPLAASSETTTSWVGAMGVRPASTTKVTIADSSASATAAMPRERAIQPAAGAAALTSSAVAAWPTWVIRRVLAQREFADDQFTRSGGPP